MLQYIHPIEHMTFITISRQYPTQTIRLVCDYIVQKLSIFRIFMPIISMVIGSYNLYKQAYV